MVIGCETDPQHYRSSTILGLEVLFLHPLFHIKTPVLLKGDSPCPERERQPQVLSLSAQMLKSLTDLHPHFAPFLFFFYGLNLRNVNLKRSHFSAWSQSYYHLANVTSTYCSYWCKTPFVLMLVSS